MRIGIDARKLNRQIRTGIEEYSFHLIRNLLELDTRNEYVLYFDQSPLPALGSVMRLNRAVIQVIPMPKSPVLWAGLALPLHIWQSQLKPDVLFMPVHYAPWFDTTRLAVTAYDLIFDHLGLAKQFFHEALIRMAMVRAQKIIAISHATRNDLIEKLSVSQNKIVVVHLGYDDQVFHKRYSVTETDTVLSRYCLQDDGFILYCGTLQPRKNLIRLIEAYALLRQRNEINHRLVLVGKAGWSVAALHRRIDELGLQEHVVLTGYLPAKEVAWLMNRTAVFVFPSLYEGFGIPLLEAMACGAPVVTSQTSSMPEVVERAALLVDPYDVNQIANAIGQVLADANLRDRMRSSGLERVREFSWQKTALETLQAFESMMDIRHA